MNWARVHCWRLRLHERSPPQVFEVELHGLLEPGDLLLLKHLVSCDVKHFELDLPLVKWPLHVVTRQVVAEIEERSVHDVITWRLYLLESVLAASKCNHRLLLCVQKIAEHPICQVVRCRPKEERTLMSELPQCDPVDSLVV